MRVTVATMQHFKSLDLTAAFDVVDRKLLKKHLRIMGIPSQLIHLLENRTLRPTRPAWAGFKTAEEGRAKICKFLWQKLKNKSNIEKYIMNNCRTLLKQFYTSLRAFLELLQNLLEVF
jgi:hypothetical protein